MNNAENPDNFVKNFKHLNLKEGKEKDKNVDIFKAQITIDKEKKEENNKKFF